MSRAHPGLRTRQRTDSPVGALWFTSELGLYDLDQHLGDRVAVRPRVEAVRIAEEQVEAEASAQGVDPVVVMYRRRVQAGHAGSAQQVADPGGVVRDAGPRRADRPQLHR